MSTDAMASMPGMAGMAGSAMPMSSAATFTGWLVLAVFFVVSAFEAATLVEQSPRVAARAITLERFALLTGSLAMVAMAAGMLTGAVAPINV
jgi:hypothetical protein